MSEFEAQCDCELDSPGVLSHLPVEERLEHWREWALYLRGRIETHYRPEVARLQGMLDIAWQERRKIRVERKYGISIRTKKMWLADLAACYEKRSEEEK